MPGGMGRVDLDAWRERGRDEMEEGEGSGGTKGVRWHLVGKMPKLTKWRSMKRNRAGMSAACINA